MKASVALCTYNGAKYIYEQLKSIVEQIQLPDELVICDDASTDETVDIINKFKENCNIKIKLYINKQNLGFRKNFEKCISLCSNDIIFLCDQDDIWLPDKVKIFMQAFESDSNLVYAFSDAYVVDEFDNIKKQHVWDKNWTDLSKQEMFNYFEKLNFPLGFSVAVKRDYACSVMTFMFDHDGWLALFAPLYGNIAPIQNRLVKYRRHSSTTSEAFISKGKFEILCDSFHKFLYDSFENYFIYPTNYHKQYELLLKSIEDNKSDIDTVDLINHLKYYEIILKCKKKNFFFRFKNFLKIKKSSLYSQFRSCSNKQFVLDLIFLFFNSFKKIENR